MGKCERKKYRIERVRYRFAGCFSYNYRIINAFDGAAIKGGFSSDYDAISWFINQPGYSILDLEL